MHKAWSSIQEVPYCFYASAFRRQRHYVFGLSVRPSVRSPKYPLSTCTWVRWSIRDRFTACPSVRLSVHPSVRLERFPGICQRTHEGNGLKFCMLMYLEAQNWLDYGHGLFIFLLLVPLWLSETGQIWCFRAFPGDHMEGMGWNFVCWCIVTTFRNDEMMVMVCSFSSFWRHFDLVKRVKFGVSGHYLENAWREWAEILYAGVSWPPSELISFWLQSVAFSNFGTILT